MHEAAIKEPPRITLLLTATVSPPSHVPLRRTDPSVRLADYLTAIEFWSRNPDPRVHSLVFVENSGSGQEEIRGALSALQGRYAQVEFVDASPNEVEPGVHYGYAELAMIDRAFQQSASLRSATHFVKVTGRLMFPEIPGFLDQVQPGTRFIVDARNVRIFNHVRRFIPFQLACYSSSFFQQTILHRRSELQRSHSGFETMFFDELIGLKGQAGCDFRFRRNCEPVGLAAHRDKDYRSPARQAVNLLRSMQRRLLPWLWI